MHYNSFSFLLSYVTPTHTIFLYFIKIPIPCLLLCVVFYPYKFIPRFLCDRGSEIVYWSQNCPLV